MLATMGNAGDPFDRAFAEVEAHWDQEAAHRKFIAFCRVQGALAEAGRRYRAVRDGDPTRREAACRWIDAVLAAAMQNMEVLRTEKPRRSKKLTWVVVAASVCLMLYTFLSVLRASSP